jgi:ring-1,2-phenylacetyl-CoA epoxidase subunit PaaC
MNLTNESHAALRDLLFKMADDCLILGHRNSEWVGIGPVLEEDIAFASIAQDKLGHALGLYTILHEHLGEADPDTLGFMRVESNFKCCHFVEIPTQEYDFALMRHFLFDNADSVRFEMLATSTFEPLAQLARKVRGEVQYHTMHANAFIKQLSNGSEEAHFRLQSALNESWALALGIFEPSKYEEVLAHEGIFAGEVVLQERWLSAVTKVLDEAGLTINTSVEAVFGGRNGYHTEHLAGLLEEMSEVFATDPAAEW